MTSTIQHQRAVELARETEWEDERDARATREKAERAAHRRWLKETKPHREAQRAMQRRFKAARARIFGAAMSGASTVADNVADTAASREAAYDAAWFAILDAAGLAAEAAAAKASGYETWAAFEAATEAEDGGS
jgi:hypothetical protein